MAFSLLTLNVTTISADNLSPLDFGLGLARTGEERYEVLLKTHQTAASQGMGVSYSGINRIELDVPPKAKSIPLSDFTDFAGVEIYVRNKQKNMVLFSISNELQSIKVSKRRLHNGRFLFNRYLRKGTKLLVVIDRNLWVKQRRGYKNGATRKDVLLIKEGKAQNQVISSYKSSMAMPEYFFCDVTDHQIIIKGLTFTRSYDSDHITRLIELKNLNDVLIKDIVVNTPDNPVLYGESAFYVENSTNVTFEDVTINGTYSLKDKYGYGIGMNNVWNSRFLRLKASGNWGVFGNNNVNLVHIEDSDINRFDIHCYGKDVYCKNTVFRDLYNQFSSFSGTLRFENCKFLDFVPVLFEPSYSAYTFFNLEIEDCYISASSRKPYLISAGNPSLLSDEPRTELSVVQWPDIRIDGLEVDLPPDVDHWTIFSIKGEEGALVSGINNLSIDSLVINGGNKHSNVYFTNKRIALEKALNVQVNESNISIITRDE